MVKINCSRETSEFFGCPERVRTLAIKKDDIFWQGYKGTVIGDCAFVPYGNCFEIYEADEWKFGVEEEEND